MEAISRALAEMPVQKAKRRIGALAMPLHEPAFPSINDIRRAQLIELAKNPPKRMKWLQLTNEEALLLAFQFNKENGISARSQLEKSYNSLYETLAKRGLMGECFGKPLGEMSRRGLVELGKRLMEENGIKNKTEFDRKFDHLSRVLKEKGAFKELGFEELRRNFHSMDDSSLLAYARKRIWEIGAKSRASLSEKDPKLYEVLHSRKLMDSIHFSKELTRWGTLDDDHFAAEINKAAERKQIFTFRELELRSRKEYSAVFKRIGTSPGITQKLNLLYKRTIPSISDSQLREWIGKFVRRDRVETLEGLRASAPLVLSEIRRRGWEPMEEIFNHAHYPVKETKRTSREAEAMLMRNQDLVRHIIFKRSLLKLCDYDTSAQIARFSIFKSALRWDGDNLDPNFRPFAIMNSKDTWREIIFELENVHIPVHIRSHVARFHRLSSGKPDFSFDEYAKREGLQGEAAENIRHAIPMHTGSLRNALPQKKGGEEATPEYQDAFFTRHGRPAGAPFEAEERIFGAELKQKVGKALGRLSERHKRIITMQFGLGRYRRPHTLDEIGSQIGVSRERVRQISDKVLGRLKRDPLVSTLFREMVIE